MCEVQLKSSRSFEYGTSKMETAASKKMENVTNTNPRSFQRSHLGLSVWVVIRLNMDASLVECTKK